MNILKDAQKYFLVSNGGEKHNGSYNSDINYSINGVITDEKHILYNTVSINHAEIPYSFYVVNVYNNLLSLSTGDIYIDRGNYNATSLLKFINSKLPINMVLSFNSTNGKYTFTYNQPFTIKTTSTINKIIGIEKNTQYNSINNIIECPYPVNLLGTKNLYIKSNLMLSNLNTSTNDYITLACIPVSVEPYSIILFNNFSNSAHIVKNRNLDNIEVLIYDDDNNLVNFNNIDWSITLEINKFILYLNNPTTINEYLNNIK